MSVEFIGMIGTRDQSEIRPSRGPVVDRDYVRRFARAHEDAGFDRVLIGYASSQPDGGQVAACAAAHTDRLSFLVAHRPGFVAPTLAARTFATLDQFAGGRIAVHIITGGSAAEQRRDGDYLASGERYDRTSEYLDIMKLAQTREQIASVLAAAARGELHDRALWTPLAAATGAAGNSTALVGTPETVARALLDYVDIGVTTILIRGYDPYDDAIDYGRHLLPLVREEVARRERAVAPAELVTAQEGTA
ncbi:MAG: LLM class flavin-dependent oxidoreductase [Streptosporangiaceae bacterium]